MNFNKPQDNQLVEDAFFEALGDASNTFLSGVSVQFSYDQSRPTQTEGLDAVNINFNDSMARILLPTLASWKEAWLLILAHETGHLHLNSICEANGEPPAEPDAQLRAIGIDPTSSDFLHAADFQKESAIESFCDASLAKAAIDFLGPRWKMPVETLRDHRAKTSRKIGFFKPDEYATQPALDAILETHGKIEPGMAAEIALRASLLHTSKIKIAAICSANKLWGFADQWQKKITEWRHTRKVESATTQPKDESKPKH